METSDTIKPLLHSVPRARKILGDVGNTTFYGLVKAGRIRTVKIGNRTFVPDCECVRFHDELLG